MDKRGNCFCCAYLPEIVSAIVNANEVSVSKPRRDDEKVEKGRKKEKDGNQDTDPEIPNQSKVSVEILVIDQFQMIRAHRQPKILKVLDSRHKDNLNQCLDAVKYSGTEIPNNELPLL